jgi:hypothetical protein
LPGEAILTPLFIGGLQLLKTLGADNFSDTNNKSEALVGQICAGPFESFELFAEAGVSLFESD